MIKDFMVYENSVEWKDELDNDYSFSCEAVLDANYDEDKIFIQYADIDADVIIALDLKGSFLGLLGNPCLEDIMSIKKEDNYIYILSYFVLDDKKPTRRWDYVLGRGFQMTKI